MLPQAYELPAALVLVLAGALACFAGYRLFRYVLALFGFILGAMIASSTMGISNTVGMIVAALVGGLVGAAILMFAYFVGIALVGAGVGALVAHFGWAPFGSGDPPVLLVIGLAVAGAIAAMFAAAARDHRHHRIRRRVDAHRRDPCGGGRPRRAGGEVREQRVDSVSDDASTGTAVDSRTRGSCSAWPGLPFS